MEAFKMIEKATTFMSVYSVNEIWDFVKNKLLSEYGEAIYHQCFSKLEVINFYNGVLELNAPTIPTGQGIIQYYAEPIKKLWKLYDNSIIALRVSIQNNDNTSSPDHSTTLSEENYGQFTTYLNNNFSFDHDMKHSLSNSHTSSQKEFFNTSNTYSPDISSLLMKKDNLHTTHSFEEIWESVKNKLLNEFGEATYNSWISKLELVNAQNGILELAAPTKFMREWIRNHYAAAILRFWKLYDNSIIELDILISNTQISIPSSLSSENIETNTTPTSTSTTLHIHDDVFNTPLDKRFTFDNFVVGTPNELAYAAARSVAESSKVHSEANPLFLYGGVGLGKTHLMHAVAWHIKNTNPSRKVIYISAEKFMYQFIKALRNHDVMSFKELLRSVDVLMIDDVQFICGKDSTQAEFFHTLNALIDNNRQVIISADRSPSDLDGMEERIKSRLGWGLVADVHSTTYELRVGILMSKLEQMKISVSMEVIEFLADKITSNVRELEGALNKVVAHSTLVGRKISLESTQEILQDLLRSNTKTITLEEIKRKIAEKKNVKLSDLTSTSRERHIVRARQIAMYLSRTLTLKSLAEIGKNFGGRDHTTVMHAIKQIEDLIQSDPEISEDVKTLTRTLQN
jgi:chromosomal replication initiator protein